jgi:hypothetical protein
LVLFMTWVLILSIGTGILDAYVSIDWSIDLRAPGIGGIEALEGYTRLSGTLWGLAESEALACAIVRGSCCQRGAVWRLVR